MCVLASSVHYVMSLEGDHWASIFATSAWLVGCSDYTYAMDGITAREMWKRLKVLLAENIDFPNGPDPKRWTDLDLSLLLITYHFRMLRTRLTLGKFATFNSLIEEVCGRDYRNWSTVHGRPARADDFPGLQKYVNETLVTMSATMYKGLSPTKWIMPYESIVMQSRRALFMIHKTMAVLNPSNVSENAKLPDLTPEYGFDMIVIPTSSARGGGGGQRAILLGSGVSGMTATGRRAAAGGAAVVVRAGSGTGAMVRGRDPHQVTPSPNQLKVVVMTSKISYWMPTTGKIVVDARCAPDAGLFAVAQALPFELAGAQISTIVPREEGAGEGNTGEEGEEDDQRDEGDGGDTEDDMEEEEKEGESEDEYGEEGNAWDLEEDKDEGSIHDDDSIGAEEEANMAHMEAESK
jgi:hypothetical protein